MTPLWDKLKAKLLGREVLDFHKVNEEKEYRSIKRLRKYLAWGHPDQLYE